MNHTAADIAQMEVCKSFAVDKKADCTVVKA
jgi:hypothetical protein